MSMCCNIIPPKMSFMAPEYVLRHDTKYLVANKIEYTNSFKYTMYIYACENLMQSLERGASGENTS